MEKLPSQKDGFAGMPAYRWMTSGKCQGMSNAASWNGTQAFSLTPRMDVARRVEYVLIDEALGRGESVTVDDTNLTKDVRRRHVNLAKMRGATVNVIYFTNNEQAFRQNDRREAGLPVGALRKRRDELEPPETDEGFELVQIVPDVSWPDTSD